MSQLLKRRPPIEEIRRRIEEWRRRRRLPFGPAMARKVEDKPVSIQREVYEYARPEEWKRLGYAVSSNIAPPVPQVGPANAEVRDVAELQPTAHLPQSPRPELPTVMPATPWERWALLRGELRSWPDSARKLIGRGVELPRPPREVYEYDTGAKRRIGF